MILDGKVALITGSSRGIGRAIALALAKEGADIIVNYRQSERLARETVKVIQSTGRTALALKADVTKYDQVEALIKQALDKFTKIDILVNNAGINSDATLSRMSTEMWNEVISVNLTGVFNCTKAVVNTMLAQQSGVILNSSSIVGRHGNFGQTNYAASKSGVIAMVKTWARELGRKGIRSNAVCPGFVTTSILGTIPERVLRALEEKVPLGRLGRPEEIANTFAWLASDEASYINGAVIEVSGGLTI